MFSKFTNNNSSSTSKSRSKTGYGWGFAITFFILASGLSATSMTTEAASLGDLFSKDKSAAQSKFLPVDQAFQVTSTSKATDKGTHLAINFDITPKHYVYKDQIKLILPAGITATPFNFSQSAVAIDDPTFGKVPVFDQANVVATTTLSSEKGLPITNAAITIGWQGCAKAGLCYPPEKIKTSINIAASTLAPVVKSPTNTATAANPNALTSPVAELLPVDDDVVDYALIEQGSAEGELNASNTLSGADTEVVGSDATAGNAASDANNDETANNSNKSDNTNDTYIASGLEQSDPFGLATHPWLALGLLFLAGLGLALTPCVLPMLPIVANIVARQQNPTAKKGVILTTSYAIGVASAYGILGAVIAIFGESLGIIGWLQNPIILISFAIVFVLLALYMLGVFSLRLPHAIRSQMHSLSQAGDSKLGSVGGSFIVGFLSALVVSPCVSAPLFGALLAVSTIGSPWLGFIALFMLGFGLSAPLILIGATQGRIMPKAGEWMNWVKLGFALLLLAVALLLIERVFISPVMLLVWALWFMVVATWAWSWRGKAYLLTRALALIVGIWAATLVVGAALGNDDSLHPLASLSAAPMMVQADERMIGNSNSNSSTANSYNKSDIRITTLAQLDTIISANPKVIVDVTADWCVECRIMDKNLFHNPPIQMQDWQLVRLDITETTEDSTAILKRYQLFGPPTLLYYKQGQLVDKQVGEIGRQEFERTLTTLNNPSMASSY